MYIKRNKEKRLRASRRRSVRNYVQAGAIVAEKKTILRYTGSPDSVDVANLLDQFNYRPAQRDAILRKYE